MFTGIIHHRGVIQESLGNGVDAERLLIESPLFAELPLPCCGDSIAIDGVCLTVTDIQNGVAAFDVGSETLRRTTLGEKAAQQVVHLEQSLTLSSRLDGHIVLGHVDGVGAITSRTLEGETVRYAISYPPELAPYIAEKGSITIDGVSLTVGEISAEEFVVYVIPHTQLLTKLGEYEVHARVNLEIDCLARYVERILHVRGGLA